MAVATRSAGVVSLVGAVTAAVALAGVAAFTVANADCADPGRYVRHAEYVELVGGCVDQFDLPPAKVAPPQHHPTEPASLSP
jgi:hypothetical protein